MGQHSQPNGGIALTMKALSKNKNILALSTLINEKQLAMHVESQKAKLLSQNSNTATDIMKDMKRVEETQDMHQVPGDGMVMDTSQQ